LPLLAYIRRIKCPRCGTEESQPHRAHFPGYQAPPWRTLDRAPCLACRLRALSLPQQHQQIALMRALWMHARGSLEDMPPILRAGVVTGGAPTRIVPPRRPHTGNGQRLLRPGLRGRPKSFHVPLPALAEESRPRALFCLHDLSLSGGPIIVANLAPLLRELQCRVYSPKDGPLKARLQASGIPVTHDPDLANVDLVIANCLPSAPCVERAREAGKPCVWMIHEFVPSLCGNEDAVAKVIGYPERVIFPHQSTADNYAKFGLKGVEIIPTVIPPTPVRDRKEAREKLRLKGNVFAVLFVGMKEHRKGWDVLEAAMRDVAGRLLRLCDQDDPWTYYGAADVLVNASRMESFPLSLQEAIAYHLPIVASDIPGNRAVLEPGSVQWFSPGKAPDLAAALNGVKASVEAGGAPPARLLAGIPSFGQAVSDYERSFLAATGRAARGPLTVVYHCAQFGPNRQSIPREQLEALAACGIRRVLMTHCGELLDETLALGRGLGLDLTCEFHSDKVDCFERPALELIEKLVKDSEAPILYLHTKGMSHADGDVFWHNWRRLQMAALVARWKEHVQALNEFDCVGVNWWRTYPSTHFSGNFWMARASYLRTLPRVSEYWRDRYSAERWIGSVQGCKAKSLLCENAVFWSNDRELFNKLCRTYLSR
jgi:glycosyltransferase involved in cell wall biosynthesis